MTQAHPLTELIEPQLPGAWIIQRDYLWQMKLLNAGELATFSYKRGLFYLDEADITQLWQMRLLKADLISSEKKIRVAGLVYRGLHRNGYHVYSDERDLPQRRLKWENIRLSLKPLDSKVKLFFHPFRYYVLYHLNRVLDMNVSPIMFFQQEGYHKLVDMCLSSFNRWTGSDVFRDRIKYWNTIASLAIITEPCFYSRMFGHFHYPLEAADSVDSFTKQMNDLLENQVKPLYERVGKDTLEEIRHELCAQTQMLEPNRWIHTLICLGERGIQREKLEGHLGGALLLRTIAEMLRHTTEHVFQISLREEDEIGIGWVPEGVKKTLYGSNHLLDDSKAAREFIQRYGLHYGLRVHWYVEGETEYGAINSFFQASGITVTNLRGLVREGKSKNATILWDNLDADVKNQLYSILMIDKDVRENVKVLEQAARYDKFCGAFFLSDLDFEFGNFEVEELEEVLWQMAGIENISQEDRNYLHEHVKSARKSGEFFKGVEQASLRLTQLIQSDKGEKWGEQLMRYAWENPYKQGKERQVVEAVKLALFWSQSTNLEPYEVTRAKYKVSPDTGRLVERINTESTLS